MMQRYRIWFSVSLMNNVSLTLVAKIFRAVLIWVACFSISVAANDGAPQQHDMEIAADDGRVVQTRLFAPANGCDVCALVIFSHGAFSTNGRYDRLLLAWARAGFVVAAPLHVDSEAHPDREDYAPDAALPTRVEDYRAVRDALTQAGRLQAISASLSGEVIAAGHSFGALIAQIAGGANPPSLARETLDALADRPPAAVVAISPPPAMDGYIELSHWAQITVPMLVVTGTADLIPGFVTDWRQHLLSYEAASTEQAYALIFAEVDHYFNGAFGRPTPEGERMASVIGDLNRSVVGFIHAVQDDVSPADSARWQALPDTVRTLANGQMIGDE